MPYWVKIYLLANILIIIRLILWGIDVCSSYEEDIEREVEQMLGECNGLIYHPTKNSPIFD